jgi:hypothetical protein
MKLELLSTVISTKYSEDSTIRITAVDANNGYAPVTSWTGTVTLSEHGFSIYTQNWEPGGGPWQTGSGLPPSVTISSGGTATFVAYSLAGPSVEGSLPPAPARITTNYPTIVDGSTDTFLLVPQWITTFKSDPFVVGPVYDWLYNRVRDIVNGAYVSGDQDLQTALSTILNYDAQAISANGRLKAGFLGDSKSGLTINPYFTMFRLDSPTPGRCFSSWESPHALAFTLYHEARHAYQRSLATAANDEDRDALVNAIRVSPSDIFIDTTVPRLVCDEYKNSTLPFTFKGPGAFDALGDEQNSIPGVVFALEMDAHLFAYLHVH